MLGLIQMLLNDLLKVERQGYPLGVRSLLEAISEALAKLNRRPLVRRLAHAVPLSLVLLAHTDHLYANAERIATICTNIFYFS